MIQQPPACLVRSLDEARRVVATGLPATLLSARGAACFAGPLLWRTLVEAARAEAGDAARLPDILDCIDAPGRAVEALRLGQRMLILDQSCALYDDVFGRAASMGAVVLAVRPVSFDVGRGLDLAGWLRQGVRP